MVHVDTWRAAYGGIVPGAYLENLSYERSERLWRDVLAEDDGVFVAEDEGGVFGFASGGPRERFSRNLAEYEGELQTVCVLPSHRGRGAGGRLVRAVAGHLAGLGVRSMLLWAFAENRSARGFYESLGGVVVAEDEIEIGGARLAEVAYGWKNLRGLLSWPGGA